MVYYLLILKYQTFTCLNIFYLSIVEVYIAFFLR